MLTSTERKAIEEMIPEYRATLTAELRGALIETFDGAESRRDDESLADMLDEVQDFIQVLGEILDLHGIDDGWRSSREERLEQNEAVRASDYSRDETSADAKITLCEAVTRYLYNLEQSARLDAVLGSTQLADENYLLNLSNQLVTVIAETEI